MTKLPEPGRTQSMITLAQRTREMHLNFSPAAAMALASAVTLPAALATMAGEVYSQRRIVADAARARRRHTTDQPGGNP